MRKYKGDIYILFCWLSFIIFIYVIKETISMDTFFWKVTLNKVIYDGIPAQLRPSLVATEGFSKSGNPINFSEHPRMITCETVKASVTQY